MSGTRQQQHPWLADHVIFFSYRWLTWVVVAGVSLAYGLPGESGRLLVLTALVNVLATVVAQAYVRSAQRNPLLMALDLVYMMFILVESDGWNVPYFALHATSSLVIPGMLFGSQGGFIAGWAFVALEQAVRWGVNRSASQLIEQGGVSGLVLLATMMATPPIFGWVFPAIVGLVRRIVEQHGANKDRQRHPAGRPGIERGTGSGGIARLPARGPNTESSQASATREFPFAASITAVRASEPNVEDLRRVLFAPFPTDEMDLPAVLELLATRFGDHTGAISRVALLGRVRAVHHVNRKVLVRLTQEALLNVQQHAHAASITLTLRYDATSVSLLIQDDGVGLLDGTFERPGGLHALRAMQYRLSELGGRLNVFETEGGGVTVRATMPLE